MTMRRTCVVMRYGVGTPRRAVSWAEMGMPRLSIEVPDLLARRVKVEAKRLWPGDGQRSVNRLTVDALARYRRYCNDTARR